MYSNYRTRLGNSVSYNKEESLDSQSCFTKGMRIYGGEVGVYRFSLKDGRGRILKRKAEEMSFSIFVRIYRSDKVV